MIFLFTSCSTYAGWEAARGASRDLDSDGDFMLSFLDEGEISACMLVAADGSADGGMNQNIESFTLLRKIEEACTLLLLNTTQQDIAKELDRLGLVLQPINLTANAADA